MPSELTEKELSEFREIFNLVDTDGNGRITQQELRNLMEALRLRPTEDELYDMFTEARGIASSPPGGVTGASPITGTGAGTSTSAVGGSAVVGASGSSAGGGGGMMGENNGSGQATIDFNQFVSIMSKRVQSEYTPEQLRNAFMLFETEDLPVGVVSTAVLEHALMTYGTEKLGQDEAARLLASVDPEGTGQVNYLDFVALVTGEER